jgi:hypothetical protein
MIPTIPIIEERGRPKRGSPNRFDSANNSYCISIGARMQSNIIISSTPNDFTLM